MRACVRAPHRMDPSICGLLNEAAHFSLRTRAYVHLACDGERRGQSERSFPRRYDFHTCALGLPQWTLDALRMDNDRPTSHDESAEAARRRCSMALEGTAADAPFPQSPPNYTLDHARDVVQEQPDMLPFEVFFDRHASRGFPVVLRDAIGNQTARRELQSVMLAAISDMLRDHAGHAEAEICTEPACFAASAISARLLDPVFAVPPPLPRTFFAAGPLFFGTAGDSFGSPTHVDGLCQGQLSVQASGQKRWTLWSPSWPTPLDGDEVLPPHTRFEATLEEGDILFFAPGWYHATRIERGPSVSATIQFEVPPMYSRLRSGFARDSPFGYGSCATDALSGWESASAAWREISQAKGLLRSVWPTDDPASIRRAAEAVPTPLGSVQQRQDSRQPSRSGDSGTPAGPAVSSLSSGTDRLEL